jgi:hypothetical protein
VSVDSVETLVRKLVERLHLSAPERRRLPPTGVPLSLLVASVEAIVRESGSFPADVDPDGPFEGAMLLPVPDGFSVRWRHEVGVGRYETVRAQQFSMVTDAARVVALSWSNGIDGIRIDETG